MVRRGSRYPFFSSYIYIPDCNSQGIRKFELHIGVMIELWVIVVYGGCVRYLVINIIIQLTMISEPHYYSAKVFLASYRDALNTLEYHSLIQSNCRPARRNRQKPSSVVTSGELCKSTADPHQP